MPLPNIFTKEVTDEMISRINKLKPDSQPQWGKMDVAQMLAHSNVGYEMVYDNIHPHPNAFMKLILKYLVKNKVVGEKPYSRSMKTAPQFLISNPKNFEAEKKRLIDYVNKTQMLGADYFDNKDSGSFGLLSKTEWNNLFYKHLDHHLKQFGV
ncbi:MAG TPA: DUF1569 domain-containing protein [Ignavibacteria bacterium]|nr:DUF1569 domain-containing protein [Ignavibacteria bacterium]HMR42119.1 DUF1569 domain-containing protein [Ignavibacteria bacterium]